MQRIRNLVRGFSILVFAVFLCTTCATAPREDTLSPQLGLDPAVVSGTLENGLTYYIRPNSEPENRIVLRLAVDAGSVFERDDQKGLAHFVEHMAFNGTKDFPGQKIVDFLESVGMKFGPEINASTSSDETVFTLSVPANDLSVVNQGIHVLREWATNISFDPEEVEKEKGVILEEWRLGRGAGGRLRDRYFPVLLQGSLYADRLAIGDPDIVRHASSGALREFYHTWYQPEAMAVVVVGDIDPAKAQEMIHTWFDPIPASQDPHRGDAKRVAISSPDSTHARAVVALDPEAPGTRVSLYYLAPSRALRTEHDYRQLIGLDLFSIMLNDRLEERTREGNPPFIYGYSGLIPINRKSRAFVLTTRVDEGASVGGLEALLYEAGRASSLGFSTGELEKAKESLLRSYQKAWDERTTTDSARYADELVTLFLDGDAAPGIDRELELVKRLLPEMSQEEVQRLPSRLFSLDTPVVVLTGPEKDGLSYPDEDELLHLVSKVKDTDFQAYVPAEDPDSLLSNEPVPGSILKKEPLHSGSSLPVSKISLSNGSQVWVMRTDYKSDQILFGAISPGGASLADDENYVSAILAPSLVSQGGIGEYDLSALRNFLAGKALQLNASLDDRFFILSGTCGVKELEPLFQLAYLSVVDPRYDDAAAKAYVQRLSAALKNRESDPETQFNDQVLKMLYDDHPRSRPLTSKRVEEEASVQEAFDFYDSIHKGGAGTVWILVGNLPEDEELEPLVTRYLAALPTGNPTAPVDRGMQFSEKKSTVRSFDGIGQKAQVKLFFSGGFDGSRRTAVGMRLLKELYTILLRDELRENEGGTYGVSIGTNFRYAPEAQYLFSISFGCDPERSQKLKEKAEEILMKYRTTPFPSEALVRAKQIIRAGLEESDRQNGYWFSALVQEATGGPAAEPVNETDQLVDRFDNKSLVDLAETILRPEHRMEAVLLPKDFSKE